MPKSQRKSSFPPFSRPNARLLILGTLPGDDSLKFQQFYAHKYNAFWRLIAELSGKDLPVDYEDRRAMLIRNRWALWDVLASAERLGSSDAAIKYPVANAFAPFFASHPRLEAIAFNGQKARSLFTRYVLNEGQGPVRPIQLINLPSSSPLHTMAYDQKLALWRSALEAYIPGRARKPPKTA